VKGIPDLSALATEVDQGVHTNEGNQEVHMNEDPVLIRGVLEVGTESTIVHLVTMIIGADPQGLIVRNHIEGVIAEVPCVM